jgi:hypothetical protein
VGSTGNASPDDHVGFAIGDVEESIGVSVADIARVKPSTAKRLVGRVRILEIAFENIRSAKDYLAQFAVGHFVIVVVDDLHLVPDRFAA